MYWCDVNPHVNNTMLAVQMIRLWSADNKCWCQWNRHPFSLEAVLHLDGFSLSQLCSTFPSLVNSYIIRGKFIPRVVGRRFVIVLARLRYWIWKKYARHIFSTTNNNCLSLYGHNVRAALNVLVNYLYVIYSKQIFCFSLSYPVV